MLYLDHSQLMEALTLDETMGSVERALRIYETNAFVMPDRLAMNCGENNTFLLMPSIADGNMATKVLTLFPGNRALNKPVIDAIVMLLDQATGAFLCLMDGKTLTSMRTGAVTGASIRHLAREDARSVGLVGCGAQGYYQLIYACAARKIDRIALFDIDQAAIPPLVERLKESLPGIDIEISGSTEALVRASDIVITATTARTPVFPDDPALFEGKHFVAIGSFQPDVREYPDALFARTKKVWIDIHFACEESGELLVPLREGILKEEQLETLGHFILSGAEPDRGPYGTTFFKTVGMALFDLTAAQLAYARATEKGIGTTL